MPVPYHHLYFSGFAEVVRAAGLDKAGEWLEVRALLARETEARKRVAECSSERAKAVDAFLTNHYELLRPHLRDCHKRRFDSGKKEVSCETWDF
jgi:hypothetical protein